MKKVKKFIIFLMLLSLSMTSCVQFGFYDSEDTNMPTTSTTGTDETEIKFDYEKGEDDKDILSESAGVPDATGISHGLWVSETKDDDGRNYGMYFIDEKNVLLIGWTEKDAECDSGYFIKGSPYLFKINSNGISLTAGYGYGSDIVEDEIKDGIPKLEYDGENIICTGGEVDGMTFSYTSEFSDYVVDN